MDEGLTLQEKNIADMLKLYPSLTRTAIGLLLGISVRTVETHINNIFAKNKVNCIEDYLHLCYRSQNIPLRLIRCWS